MKPFELTVEEEVTIFAVVYFFGEECQQPIVEFKLAAHSMPDLMDAVKELSKNLASITKIPRTIVTASSGKHMTKGTPIFLDKNLEAFECSIIGVKEKLSQSRELRCTIPSI